MSQNRLDAGLFVEMLRQQEGVTVRSWSSGEGEPLRRLDSGAEPHSRGKGSAWGPAAGGTQAPDRVCRRAGGRELPSAAPPRTGLWGRLPQAGLGVRSTAVQKPGRLPSAGPGRGPASSGLMKEATGDPSHFQPCSQICPHPIESPRGPRSGLPEDPLEGNSSGWRLY